jgi:1,4-alpha-glucan branching enzyme
MTIKKQFLKTKNICKVTFRLPAEVAKSASRVNLVGNFNDWNLTSHPMRKLKSGEHTITLDLEPGRDYQFRYVIDEVRWENDWHADKYFPCQEFGTDNSVICL